MSRSAKIVAAVWAAVAHFTPAAGSAQSFTSLYAFPSDGSGGLRPMGVIFDHGFLYGTMAGPNFGLVYKFDVFRKQETVLHVFAGGRDGGPPASGLAYLAGNLYGATTNGGAFKHGTLFEVNAATGVETVLYNFRGRPDGDTPNGDLIYQNNVFYGTTRSGGLHDLGMVFAFDPSTRTETKLLSLGGAIGSIPEAGLTYQNGVLYGTAAAGGRSKACGNGANGGCGTVFSLNPLTGGHRKIYAFQGGSDGGAPVAGVIDHAGVLYGTTEFYGASGCGVVFAMGAFTGHETVLHTFACHADPGLPTAKLAYFAGSLYGTTASYGVYSDPDIIFKLDLMTNAYSTFSNLVGPSGIFDQYGLIKAGRAFFGGAFGGAGGLGYLFELIP
jgi:uncharacterized repeat protein (TIGR03803 family)